MKTAIIVSISSDIGIKIAENWTHEDVCIYGSFRNMTPTLASYEKQFNWNLHPCDLSDQLSCDNLVRNLTVSCNVCWDLLVFATGAQEPVGKFDDCDFNEWARSIQINAINQLRILHGLLHKRKVEGGARPIVYFFAGAGSNNAPQNYSAYIASKIFLTKMTELLAAEIKDTTFVIVGPGWVNTKIHEATLLAGPKLAGNNFSTTRAKLNSNECTEISQVIKVFNWIKLAPDSAVNGRNFSVVFDPLDSDNIIKQLNTDKDMYKLRRSGNNWRG